MQAKLQLLRDERMLLRSMRVTEKIFGSRSSKKKSNFAAKAAKKVAAKTVKNVHLSTQSFGTKQLTVLQMWSLKLTS